MSQVGLGVMIAALGGRDLSDYQAAIGKTIKEIRLADDRLFIAFTDNTEIVVSDDGQSCCEYRYMTCDDDLSLLNGDKFVGLEILSHEEKEGEWDVHEIQFLKVQSDKGSITLASHNEHNGYYGGFWIQVKAV